MRDILDAIDAAAARGEAAAVATVVATRHSAPRPVGSKLVVTEGGRLVGSVSGGCVEADLAERARDVFAGGTPRVVSYGIAESDAWNVGLACGGEIDVLLERADPRLWREVRELLERDGHGVLSSDLATGAKRLDVDADGETELRDGVFTERIEPPLRLVVFGATDVAEHLCAYGAELGWRTVVVDPRAGLATQDRLPSAGEIIVAWPGDAAHLVDDRAAVVSLTHEERLDLPALAVALEGGARYVGALGSRRVQAKRRDALVEQGFAEADVDRISGPAGLDLGGRAPAQIALAIAAEIVSVTSRRTAAAASA